MKIVLIGTDYWTPVFEAIFIRRLVEIPSPFVFNYMQFTRFKQPEFAVKEELTLNTRIKNWKKNPFFALIRSFD